MERILITGGAGFMGQHLANYLVQQNESVRSVDIRHENTPSMADGLERIKLDILDSISVTRAIEGCDVVVHNAALVPLTRAGQAFWDVNVEGTRNVLEASLNCGVRKVIYISSSSVYGLPKIMPLTESAHLSPFGDYGKSKHAGEAVCRNFMELGLDITILRPRTILGPGRLGILSILFEQIARGRRMFILGSGGNKFQLVSVHDMASAIYLAATKPCRNEEFNVGAQEFNSLRTDLESLVNHAGTRTRIISLPSRPIRPLLKLQEMLRLGPFVDYHYHVITHDVVFSTDKISQMLGWHSEYSNADMLSETYDWYVNKGHLSNSGGMSPHTKGVKGKLVGAILRLL